MKNLIIFISLIVTISASTSSDWKSYKLEYKKLYRNAIEDSVRYSIFKENLQKIDNHNEKYKKGYTTFKMAINQFADLTSEEFHTLLGYQTQIKPKLIVDQTYSISNRKTDLPTFVNWTAAGAVTEVKNQGDCGSCWSFSAVGTVEGQYFRKYGKLVSFSAQNLVDCDRVCDGCGGGYMDYALKYIQENGIMTDKDYPYTAWNQDCHVNKTSVLVKIQSIVKVGESDEKALMEAVATVGPISAGVQVTDSFQFYSSGILNDTHCVNTKEYLNHGVLAVGYGTENGVDYWIVKNSWGRKWGENGFLRMLRNANNQCGIATEPIYPVM